MLSPKHREILITFLAAMILGYVVGVLVIESMVYVRLCIRAEVISELLKLQSTKDEEEKKDDVDIQPEDRKPN